MKDTQPRIDHYVEITIEGHLDETRLACFGAMKVSLLPEGHTLISGQIVDQAALFGILIRIRDMGISLISVTRPKQIES